MRLDEAEMRERMLADLSSVAGAPVEVTLTPLAQLQNTSVGQPGGECLDALPLSVTHYHPEPGLLKVDDSKEVEETLYSDLLKSNCPVTGQPDWASVQIHYRGRAIDRTALLAYIIVGVLAGSGAVESDSLYGQHLPLWPFGGLRCECDLGDRRLGRLCGSAVYHRAVSAEKRHTIEGLARATPSLNRGAWAEMPGPK